MSKLYHSNKLPGTKAYFSTNSNLETDNIFFDEFLCNDEAELKQLFHCLLTARHLGKRFFIATHLISELWRQTKYNGLEYLYISLTRNEYANKLIATWSEDKFSAHRKLEISLLGLILFRRHTYPFISKIITANADDYDNLTKQYLGQGIINHGQEINLW